MRLITWGTNLSPCIITCPPTATRVTNLCGTCSSLLQPSSASVSNWVKLLFLHTISRFVQVLKVLSGPGGDLSGFILEISQWAPSGTPSCNFRGALFKEKGPKKGGTFWRTEKAWTQVTAESSKIGSRRFKRWLSQFSSIIVIVVIYVQKQLKKVQNTNRKKRTRKTH